MIREYQRFVIHRSVPVFDEIFAAYRQCFGADFEAYRNHCFRVYNLCRALAPSAVSDKIAIAAAFHDLGIWTGKTLDYIALSQGLARKYLNTTGRSGWVDEIGEMILYHHKCTPFRRYPDRLVEPFRKADWIDVSRGLFMFGLPWEFINKIQLAFPDAGFHAKVIALMWDWIKRNPFKPLPMMKL